MKTILDSNKYKVKNFLLQSNSYCNIDLPIYFDFKNLLSEIDKHYQTHKGIYKNSYPSGYEEVNYKLFHNKDGKYAWRLFQLIHPVLYVKLVNDIIDNWCCINKHLTDFKTIQIFVVKVYHQ